MENETPQPEPQDIPISPETICQRMITGDPNYYPQALYRGRTIYFCTEYCQRAFLDDPDQFYLAHRRIKTNPTECEFNMEQ
jgi:YHS domain-containing protein